jgi:hypothetical protein
VHRTFAEFDLNLQPGIDPGHCRHRRRLPPLLRRRLGHGGGAPGRHLEGTAADKLRTYLSPSVLVIDELGYLPLDRASTNWIFQVVSRRYEKGSVVLTSNRSPRRRRQRLVGARGRMGRSRRLPINQQTVYRAEQSRRTT